MAAKVFLDPELPSTLSGKDECANQNVCLRLRLKQCVQHMLCLQGNHQGQAHTQTHWAQKAFDLTSLINRHLPDENTAQQCFYQLMSLFLWFMEFATVNRV